MKIAVDCGHTLSGADIGAHANGVAEEKMTREVGNLVISKLKALGHSVVNCTIDNASTLNESLAYRYNTANNNNVDLFVSIHMNCFNTESPNGSEVYIHSANSSAKKYADNVLSELERCGFTKRGVYVAKNYLGYNLAVLSNTNAPALLIECLFISNKNDLASYNPKSLAEAIVKGLVGSKATSTSSSSQNNFVKQLQQTLNKTRNANLVVDGIAGPLTLGACPLLACGSMGTIVSLLQSRLNSIGFSSGNVDGMFGQNTKKAVMNFQKSRKLSVDGIVGKNTWTELLK